MQLARRLVGAALFVAVLVLGWRFAADHSSEVVIRNPVTGDMQVTLWLALLVAFGVGVVSTGALASLKLARQGLISRRYRKVIRGLEAEVHQLRNLPLDGEDLPAAGETIAPEVSDTVGRALGRGA
jgi:hypothetical protein